MVEARGVEPLSEKLSTRLSTSVADYLKFPFPSPSRQGHGSGSFINPAGRKALTGSFPTLNDARIRNGKFSRANGRQRYAATAKVLLSVTLYCSRFLRSTGLRLAYPASTIPVETGTPPSSADNLRLLYCTRVISSASISKQVQKIKRTEIILRRFRATDHFGCPIRMEQ